MTQFDNNYYESAIFHKGDEEILLHFLYEDETDIFDEDMSVSYITIANGDLIIVDTDEHIASIPLKYIVALDTFNSPQFTLVCTMQLKEDYGEEFI